MASRVKEDVDTVFGLPSGVFGPLASPARRDYAEIILHVYREHLSRGMVDALDLRRSDVQGYIANAMAARADSSFALDAHNARASEMPQIVYRNLVDASWFEERQVGSETMVSISRAVMDLMRALDGIARGASVNFTGSLQTIEVALSAVGDDPRGRAMMLAVAAQQAEDFSGRMLAVSADIRANENRIARLSGFGEMIASFFDDFVAHLVSDYKAMKSRYNPLRHASAIVSAAALYVEDDAILAELAEGYVLYGYANDVNEGRAAARGHLETVSNIFGNAHRVVDDIDSVRLRVEERVARAVRFVDAAAAAETGTIADVLGMLRDYDPSWGSLPQAAIMIDDRPYGPDSLAAARRQRNPVSAAGVAVVEHDEEMAELARARARYAEEMIPTAAGIEDFIERHLGTSDAMDLSAFVVESPREMLLLAAVRSVAAHTEPSIRERYGVSFDGASVDGAWSEYAGGVIYRKGSPSDPDRATAAEQEHVEEMA